MVELEQQDDHSLRYFVGLPDNYALRLPFRCRVGDYVRATIKSALRSVGNLSWTFVSYASRLVWAFTSAYPLISLILFLGVLLVHQVQAFQKRRAQLVRDVATMRDNAFMYLMDHSDAAHAVLHLPDGLVADLVADQDVLQGARRQRQYWNTQVWPRVVPQLIPDNRVKKSQRIEAGTGKRRDYWQWVAATAGPSASKSSEAGKRVGIREEDHEKNELGAKKDQ